MRFRVGQRCASHGDCSHGDLRATEDMGIDRQMKYALTLLAVLLFLGAQGCSPPSDKPLPDSVLDPRHP